MSSLSKLTYRSHTIPVKILAEFIKNRKLQVDSIVTKKIEKNKVRDFTGFMTQKSSSNSGIGVKADHFLLSQAAMAVQHRRRVVSKLLGLG